MKKRFVAPLTEPEQQTLTSAYHHGEKRALRRRAHAILLSDQGHTINQISEILQVRRDAVSRWFKQWEVSGFDGLIDKTRSGRTPALDEHDHKRLQALVAEHPYQIRALQARFPCGRFYLVWRLAYCDCGSLLAVMASALSTSYTLSPRNTLRRVGALPSPACPLSSGGHAAQTHNGMPLTR